MKTITFKKFTETSELYCSLTFELTVGPDQFNFREDGFFFQNLKGQSVGKKRKIKKNPQFFALALIINKIIKSFLLHVGQTLHPCSDFKFTFKKCVSMLKLT